MQGDTVTLPLSLLLLLGYSLRTAVKYCAMLSSSMFLYLGDRGRGV